MGKFIADLLVIGFTLVLVGLVLVGAASARRQNVYYRRARGTEQEIRDIAAQTKAAILTEYMRRTQEMAPERPSDTSVPGRSSPPIVIDAEVIATDDDGRWRSGLSQ